MSKIRRIQDFQHSFSFSSQQEQFEAFFDRFLKSDQEKEIYYGPRRVRARTKATEILWIFFGIHTANALEIGRRMAREQLQEAA